MEFQHRILLHATGFSGTPLHGMVHASHLAALQAAEPHDRQNHKYQMLQCLIFNRSHKHGEIATLVFQSK